MLNITSPDWQRSSETNSPQLSEHVNPHRCIWGSHHVAEFGWQQRNESHREWHYDNDWKRQMWTFVYNFPFFSHLSCRLAVVGQATSRLHRLHVFKGILEDDTGVFFFFYIIINACEKTWDVLASETLLHCYRISLTSPPKNSWWSAERHSAPLTNAINHVQQHMLGSFVSLCLYYAANYQFNGTTLTFSIFVYCYLLLVLGM